MTIIVLIAQFLAAKYGLNAGLTFCLPEMRFRFLLPLHVAHRSCFFNRRLVVTCNRYLYIYIYTRLPIG